MTMPGLLEWRLRLATVLFVLASLSMAISAAVLPPERQFPQGALYALTLLFYSLWLFDSRDR